MQSTLHIQIFGTVQGVFFRRETYTLAKTLGLTGWVKNLEDGSVEILVNGTKQKLEKLLEWCYSGPVGAKVTKVNFDWIDSTSEFQEFIIIR